MRLRFINIFFVNRDATRLQDFCQYGQIAWSGIFQIVLAFVSLYSLVGPSMFAGVGVMLISVPINAVIARISSRMQKEQMKNKDKRTRVMTEILNNIRSLKLYCWEDAFRNRLMGVRNDLELPLLKKVGIIQSSGQMLWSFIPFMVGFVTVESIPHTRTRFYSKLMVVIQFASYSLTSSKPLTADIIFPAIALFQLLTFPLAILPQVLSSSVEAWVSSGRICEFLKSKELHTDAVERIHTRKGELVAGDELIKIQGGEFKWSEKGRESTLQGIDLSVKKGELVAVVGVVGVSLGA
jgi:ATP-binding cassette, subfamily C (CFTR/MRP), member 1